MTRGLFVTGTDTGVGKTLAACALIHALAGRGFRLAAMKPIAAGASGADMTNEDSRLLIEACGRGNPGDVTPILLREAIAPHIAARHEGRSIDLGPIREAYARIAASADWVVVEGVGGFKVPLGPGLDTVDLARALALPVVMVVGMRLGCLNHALLTASAIEASGLRLAGWIANAIDPAMAAADENVAALVERLRAPLLGRFPNDPRRDARSLAASLDLAPLPGSLGVGEGRAH
jgi:dethiobiotin synthetase